MITIITDNNHRAMLTDEIIREHPAGGFRYVGNFQVLYRRRNGQLANTESMEIIGGGATVGAAYETMITNAMSRLDGEPVRD
jgi:hypothetical protein